MKKSSRNIKLEEYNEQFGEIPKDQYERLNWMIDKYHLSQDKMYEIIWKKENIERSLQYQEIKIVLYEIPEGAMRPRFRILNKSNYMDIAISNPQYVHVYSPNAAGDHIYLHRLIDEELLSLHWFVQTPCAITINAFLKTPSVFNTVDTFLAEIGIHRPATTPDWDNIGKKYSDMFNMNVWLDDALVTDGTVRKFYSILPRIEIHINYLNYATNIHQYKTITSKVDYNEEYSIDYLGKDGRPHNDRS